MMCGGCSRPVTSPSGFCRPCASREARMRAARRDLPWCPEHLIADYHRARRMGFSPDEAQRIVMDHMTTRGVSA